MSDMSNHRDPRVDLAYLRTIWALERTQLSWVRTAFAIISAGLALDKATEALSEARLLKGVNWAIGGHVGGILLSALAACLLAVATVQHQQRLVQLANENQQLPEKLAPLRILSWLVILLGLAVSSLLYFWG